MTTQDRRFGPSRFRKFTPQQVRTIRRRLVAGKSFLVLAGEYGVKPPTIARIATFEAYKEVESPYDSALFPSKDDPKTQQILKELRPEPVGIPDLARKYGVPPVAVRNIRLHYANFD